MKPDKKTALEEKKPLVSPETTSSTAIQKIKEKRAKKTNLDHLVRQILAGNITALSQAITLVEHYK